MLSIKNGELVYVNANTHNQVSNLEKLFNRGKVELQSKTVMAKMLGQNKAAEVFETWVKSYILTE